MSTTLVRPRGPGNLPPRCEGRTEAAIRVSLLERFRVDCDDISLFLSAGEQRLIAFLALNGGMLSRGFVAGNLWAETTEEGAAACLRSALWRVRHCGPPLIQTNRTHIGLEDDVAVDIQDAVRVANDIIQGGCPTPGLPEACESLRTDLLPDWYEEWVMIKRESFRQLRLRALETLSERLTADSRFREAVDVGLAAVECEPLRETAHRVIIRAHLAEGNVAEAVRQYRWYERLLETELGVEPSPRIIELISIGRHPAERVKG